MGRMDSLSEQPCREKHRQPSVTHQQKDRGGVVRVGRGSHRAVLPSAEEAFLLHQGALKRCSLNKHREGLSDIRGPAALPPYVAFGSPPAHFVVARQAKE